jgi:membrane-bound lytic murein transglycosylase B
MTEVAPEVMGAAEAPRASETSAPEPAGTAHGDAAPLAAGRRDADYVSGAWATSAAARARIPERAVRAYSGAAIALAAQQPHCHLGWTTLAALGAIESGHGTHGGSRVGEDGTVRPGIFGPRLDGAGFGAVPDTDGGRIDGDPTWDRAVGPLQFLPSTWARWGADGNGDGVADPQQLDDAALAAGRYLCSYGDLSVSSTWRAAVFAYNHLDSYVAAVAASAQRYDREAG